MSTIAERAAPSEGGRPAAPREAFFGSLARQTDAARPIRVALVNNMPDIALSRTELQFMDMLQTAAGERKILLGLYSLPAIPRGDRGRQHLAASYRPIEDLFGNPPDALVVSGTEPRQADFRDEVYWASLTFLIDWADACGVPALFSCLAAHAAVLHCDGIARTPLAQKRFGIFDHAVVAASELTEGVGARMLLPHTRWNEIDEAALVRAGYQVLSRSDEAGVGFFAKRSRSLWLFCQGHPEYDGNSLFREYRRDVLRFLTRERDSYPPLPIGYFDALDEAGFAAFRARAERRAGVADAESIMREFPNDVRPGPHWDAWRPTAVAVTRNWLHSFAAARGDAG